MPKLSQDQKVNLLLVFYIAGLVLANTLGTKVTSLFGVRVSVGIFFMPLLFLITDVVGEVKGRQKAFEFVILSILVLFFQIGMTLLCISMPPNENWNGQDAYAAVFGSTLRMTFASVVAFALSQLHDVFSFDFFKKLTKGKHLWLRNNASTILSQLIDTTVFMFIAFYQIAPKFTVPFIISLIIPYWLFKVAFALIDTPFCYLGVWWLEGKKPDYQNIKSRRHFEFKQKLLPRQES